MMKRKIRFACPYQVKTDRAESWVRKDGKILYSRDYIVMCEMTKAVCLGYNRTCFVDAFMLCDELWAIIREYDRFMTPEEKFKKYYLEAPEKNLIIF